MIYSLFQYPKQRYKDVLRFDLDTIAVIQLNKFKHFERERFWLTEISLEIILRVKISETSICKRKNMCYALRGRANKEVNRKISLTKWLLWVDKTNEWISSLHFHPIPLHGEWGIVRQEKKKRGIMLTNWGKRQQWLPMVREMEINRSWHCCCVMFSSYFVFSPRSWMNLHFSIDLKWLFFGIFFKSPVC